MDTSKENDQQHRYLRLLKPYQRIQSAFELYDMARSRVAGEIKRLHPDWINEKIRDEVNRRFIR